MQVLAILAALTSSEPSRIEQHHIDQALGASETAISAIDTLLNISMWTLGILAILLAVIGIVGWSLIRSACKGAAEQIANSRFDSYIESDEFREMTQSRVDKAIKVNWQSHLMKRLEEAVKVEGDPSPFPEKEPGK